MGRQPCCDKVGLKKGPWTADEDKKLITFILTNGHCCWRAVPKLAGLLRCGKSCRLRWTNYLRPDLKRGLLSDHEEKLVIDLHSQLGNRWSKIASHMPGRTDNEIKNHWNTHIKKKLKKMGIDPFTHKPLSSVDQNTPRQQQTELINSIPSSTDLSETVQNIEQQLQTIITTNEEPEDKNKNTFDYNIDNNGFCTDEVPLIQPHEIMMNYQNAPSTSSSSCNSSCDYNNNSNNSPSKLFLEELELPDFEWPCGYNGNSGGINEMSSSSLWNDDGFPSWEFLINGDNDIKGDYSDPNTLLSQCSRMDFDQDSWTYGIL